jgi:hypothetical protein
MGVQQDTPVRKPGECASSFPAAQSNPTAREKLRAIRDWSRNLRRLLRGRIRIEKACHVIESQVFGGLGGWVVYPFAGWAGG